jgi:hypothetical protein
MGWGKPTKTWNGQEIFVKEAPFPDLRSFLPEFEAMPFGEYPAINEDLQLIVRKPTADDQRRIPVGVVSLSYKLIQHTQVFDWLSEAIAKARIARELCQTQLYLSRYGERMLLWINMENLIFDPGDGHPLRAVAVCQNSVDKSCALEVFVMHVREVCSNGMIFGQAKTIRKRHVQQKPEKLNLVKQLSTALEWAAEDVKVLSQWFQTPVTLEAVRSWSNDVVGKKWSAREAARLYTISSEGYDGQPRHVKGSRPDHYTVDPKEYVPGACAPVKNVYHAAQALSWIAGHSAALEDRLVKTRQVEGMVKELVERIKYP